MFKCPRYAETHSRSDLLFQLSMLLLITQGEEVVLIRHRSGGLIVDASSVWRTSGTAAADYLGTLAENFIRADSYHRA